VGRSDKGGMFAALRHVQEEADHLYELAAASDPRLAMAIAHRLSSSIQGMRLAVEASDPRQRRVLHSARSPESRR
jgi:hypothetical protein